MEPEGLVSEASWSSFDAAMLAEESEMIARLLGGHHFLNELDQDLSIEMPPIFWPDHGADDLYYCLDETNHNPYCFSQVTSTTSSTSSFSLPLANNGGYCLSDSNVVPEMISGKEQIIARSIPPASCHQFNESIRVTEKTSSDQFGVSKEKSLVPDPPPHQNSQAIKKRIHVSDAEKLTTKEKDGSSIGSPKKKTRVLAPVPKKGKNAESKKVGKSASSGNEEDINADFNGQSSSCYSSEDDSNASQELNGGGGASPSSEGATPRPSGKTRAGRQSAMDPQSLYAKKRRERINERLRILQNLVPNGTKVDISTMLEEAVQYVKFLQLQIKLLSSDELWMYAPIAYNGMNIGL